MERKIFLLLWTVLSVVTGFFLPFVWGVIATVPLGILSWWVAYRSGWLE